MTGLRCHIRRHRLIAAWLIGMALLLKVLIPAGYMPEISGKSVTLVICTGDGPQHIVVAAPGSQKAVNAEMPCVFAGLGSHALAAVDPVVLALAIAFVFAAFLRPAIRPAMARVDYLRPPLRGPPFPA